MKISSSAERRVGLFIQMPLEGNVGRGLGAKHLLLVLELLAACLNGDTEAKLSSLLQHVVVSMGVKGIAGHIKAYRSVIHISSNSHHNGSSNALLQQTAELAL